MLGPTVRLSVRREGGEYLKLEVGENTLIAELKALISTRIGMPVRQQVLTHQFRELGDAQSIFGCRLTDQAVLHLKAPKATSNLIAGGLRPPGVAGSARQPRLTFA